ncbi:MAG: hypothetical protein IKU33_01210 [Bacteroidales bacterium]|nr:hypothetical protein [Bacteroidales bacterium]
MEITQPGRLSEVPLIPDSIIKPLQKVPYILLGGQYMAKLGLKDVLSLRAAGYSKKEIEALAAVDEESEKDQDKKEDNGRAPDPSVDNDQAQDDAADKESNPEPDYKKMYEELLEKNKQTEAKVTKLQQDNIHQNSAPDAEKAKQQEQESLQTLFRSFM